MAEAEKQPNAAASDETGTPVSSAPGIARRDFMKLSGLAAAAFGSASIFGTSYLNGKDPSNEYSWESTKVEYFDRTPFEVDKPTYNVLRKEIGRPNYMEHRISRAGRIGKADLDDLSTLPPDLQAFYKERPAVLELDKRLIREIRPAQAKLNKERAHEFVLHKAFFDAWSAHGRAGASVTTKPEVYDWEGVREERLEVKDPAEMTKLIIQVGRLYGSGVVRVARLNPAWVYDKAPSNGRGYKTGEPIEIPDWWEYAIVVGVPHEWDQARANPAWGQSVDAYAVSTHIAARLTHFIKSLGYAARPQSPFHGYDMILPPILVDSGCGEQGRHGFVVTPEFGANFRPAAIVTNLPMEPNKPIDIGVRKFCEHCKICAEQCPSESISFEGVKEIRGKGVDGWQINQETCHNFWNSVPGSGSCRICLINCPWSKRSDWMHTTARDIAVRDKTGAVAAGLTWMEKNFFGEHAPSHYAEPNFGTYRDIPWWFDAERFLNVKK